MRIPFCAGLLMAALCVTGPALGQEDESQALPVEESGGAEGASEGEEQRAKGLREKPLWEVGIAGGGGWLPDYPAADENHFQGIALPYAVYRGDFFRIGDGGGPRGLLVDIPWLEFNIGLDASFPVDSSDNDAREGMDNLDYLLEAGPKLIVKFLYDDPTNDLDLSLAARGVISTDITNTRYQGVTVNPALTYRRHDLFASTCVASPRWAPLSAPMPTTTISTRSAKRTCGRAASAIAPIRAISAANSPSACRGALPSSFGSSAGPRSESGRAPTTTRARCTGTR